LIDQPAPFARWSWWRRTKRIKRRVAVGGQGRILSKRSGPTAAKMTSLSGPKKRRSQTLNLPFLAAANNRPRGDLGERKLRRPKSLQAERSVPIYEPPAVAFHQGYDP